MLDAPTRTPGSQTGELVMAVIARSPRRYITAIRLPIRACRRMKPLYRIGQQTRSDSRHALVRAFATLQPHLDCTSDTRSSESALTRINRGFQGAGGVGIRNVTLFGNTRVHENTGGQQRFSSQTVNSVDNRQVETGCSDLRADDLSVKQQQATHTPEVQYDISTVAMIHR